MYVPWVPQKPREDRVVSKQIVHHKCFTFLWFFFFLSYNLLKENSKTWAVCYYVTVVHRLACVFCAIISGKQFMLFLKINRCTYFLWMRFNLNCLFSASPPWTISLTLARSVKESSRANGYHLIEAVSLYFPSSLHLSIALSVLCELDCNKSG